MSTNQFLNLAQLALAIADIARTATQKLPPAVALPSPEISPEIVAMLEQRPSYMPALPEPIEKEPVEETTVLAVPKRGTGCIPCSRDHMSTVSAALNESMRFAREPGVAHEEVQRRLAMAEDELNIAERIDLAPDKLTELPEEEQEVARDTLVRMRAIRQKLPETRTVEELEQLASDATKLRLELRMHTLPKEVRDKLMETARQVENGNLSLKEGKERIKMVFKEK